MYLYVLMCSCMYLYVLACCLLFPLEPSILITIVFAFNFYLLLVCISIHPWNVHACHMRGGQRTILWSQFFPSTLTWFVGVKLTSSSCHHWVAGPLWSIFIANLRGLKERAGYQCLCVYFLTVNTVWAFTSPCSCHQPLHPVNVTSVPFIHAKSFFPKLPLSGSVTAKEKVTNIDAIFKFSSLIWIALPYIWVWSPHFLSLSGILSNYGLFIFIFYFLPCCTFSPWLCWPKMLDRIWCIGKRS